MKFALTYDGELRSNDDYRKKWEIRKQLNPQLQELWRINPSLQRVERHRLIPARSGFMVLDGHHSRDHERAPRVDAWEDDMETIDLCADIERGGRKFRPLVRNTFALQCGLSILFMRQEATGRVYQGGDIDNRLKTLLDALAMPNQDQIVNDPTVEDPIYCLLEDDGLISALEVRSERLLSRPNASKHEVRLVIEVDVRVTDPRGYNQPFLGG